jgi:hypothetical protein
MKYRVLHLENVGVAPVASSQVETDDPDLAVVRVIELLTGDPMRRSDPAGPGSQICISVMEDQ